MVTEGCGQAMECNERIRYYSKRTIRKPVDVDIGTWSSQGKSETLMSICVPEVHEDKLWLEICEPVINSEGRKRTTDSVIAGRILVQTSRKVARSTT